MRTLLEGTLDSDTRERGRLLTDPEGRDHPGIPIRCAAQPGRVNYAVPELGEHSVAIARAAGPDAAAIAASVRDRVI